MIKGQVKAEKRSSQQIPPTGIKAKAFWRIRPGPGKDKRQYRASSFSISCPNKSCKKREDQTGDPARDKAIRCGVDAPTKCPACETAIVKGGWVAA